MTSHHCRTAGQYNAALRAKPLSVEALAYALGVPAGVAEHDVLKLVELGLFQETNDSRFERADRAGEL